MAGRDGGRVSGTVNWVSVGLVVALAVAVVVALSSGGPSSDGTVAGSIPVADRVPVPLPLSASDVTGLDIPGIGLFTREFTDLGLRDDNSLDVPSDARTVGWYRNSATPGAPGPAVLAAHVNYEGQEGAFLRLGDVRAGDRVEAYREDGTVAVFRVDRVGQYPKDAFPTGAVYAPTPAGEIRLITCGGVFNEERRSYDDNVVVFGRVESAYRAA